MAKRSSGSGTWQALWMNFLSQRERVSEWVGLLAVSTPPCFHLSLGAIQTSLMVSVPWEAPIPCVSGSFFLRL